MPMGDGTEMSVACVLGRRQACIRVQVLLPGEVGDVGFKQAMQQKWLATDKSGGEPKIVRKVDSIVDKTQQLLKDVANGKDLDKTDAEALKKRKLVKPE